MPGLNHPSPWMNDELRLFRATVDRFIEQEFVPRQAHWRARHGPEPEDWLNAGRAGILLPDVPADYGGGGGNVAFEVVVREELAYASVHFGSSIQSIVAHYLLAYGSEAQKERWLPRMARGELVAAIAMTEPGAGSDLASIRTSARRDGEHYVVNGSKTFITNGVQAGLVCLAVKTDPAARGSRGISLLMVETGGLPGYRIGRSLDKIGMHGQDTCELFFSDVRVPVDGLLGGSEGQGFFQMMLQLPYERLMIAVGAVAGAEQAVAVTTQYAKERMVFGKPLIELQNTRFKLAECRTESLIGRIFLDHCIAGFATGHFDETTAAMAKYWLTDSQCRIIDECLQLHGGYGYMTEYPIARMWADSRVQRIYAGSNEVMKEMIGWSL